MKEIVTEIRESEAKAKKMIEDAEKKKSEIVLEAKHQSMKRLNDGKASVDRENDESIKRKSHELESVRSKIMRLGEDDLVKIDDKAKKNMQKTEELIIRRFEEKILK